MAKPQSTQTEYQLPKCIKEHDASEQKQFEFNFINLESQKLSSVSCDDATFVSIEKELRRTKQSTFFQELQYNLFEYAEYAHLDYENSLKVLSKLANYHFPSSMHSLCSIVITYKYEPFIQDDLHNVVKLVPRTKYWALDRHFPSFIRKKGVFNALMPLACELADRGKLRVGDVVQMSENEVFTLLQGDTELMDLLKEQLAEVGLELGMKAPRWKSPGGLICPTW